MAIVDSDDFKITDPAEMLVKALPLITLHPGQFIRTVLMPEYGLKKIAPLADMLGITRTGLSQVLHGHSDVSRDLAYRFGALLNDHVADMLISYQLAWDKQSETERRQSYKSQIKPLELQ